MDPELRNAIALIACQNLARDLASATGATASDLAGQYAVEAYKSIQIGGDTYREGQTAFAAAFIDRAITTLQAAQSTTDTDSLS